MSIVVFKRKSVTIYGSRHTVPTTRNLWLPQGPFGHATTTLLLAESNPGPGFSINGGRRNVGYVGKGYAMSKSGTPFRGPHPIGWGGTYGQYPRTEPTMNVREVDTLGTQEVYVKPSVLSNRGMLVKRYRWAFNGTYPNYWVKPKVTDCAGIRRTQAETETDE